MKKTGVMLLLMSAIVLQYCSSSKNVATAKEQKITYSGNIQNIMSTHCTPCHFPPKGNKKAYNNYLAVKEDIDAILNRINRNPGEKGFMPFKHEKLSDSTINVFVQWKKDGLPEN